MFMDKEFIIKPNTSESITISVRFDKEIIEEFDKLAKKSGHSRNSLLNMAAHYALKNLKFEDK